MGSGASVNVYELISQDFQGKKPGISELLLKCSDERSLLRERMQDDIYLWGIEDALVDDARILAAESAGGSRRSRDLDRAAQRHSANVEVARDLPGLPDDSVVRLHGYMTNHLLEYVAEGKDPNFINLFAQMTQSIGEHRGEAVRQQKMLQYAALHTPIAKRRNLAKDQTAQYQLAVLEQGIQSCGYTPEITVRDARVKELVENNKRAAATAITLGAIGVTSVANASVAAAAPSPSSISSESMIVSSVPLKPGIEFVGNVSQAAPSKVTIGTTPIEGAAPLAAGVEVSGVVAEPTKVSVGATAIQSEPLPSSIDFVNVSLEDAPKAEISIDTSRKTGEALPASVDFNAPSDQALTVEVTIDSAKQITPAEGEQAVKPGIDVTKAPDDAIEAKPTETAQEAIARVAVESKDYDRTRTAVVLIYGDQAAPKSTNKGLEGAAITAGLALNEQVGKGAHKDAGEEKIANMIKLAAYFDAAVSDQSILSNPEVQQAIAELTKVPEGYEGRLIQAYIEEAKKALEADEGKLFAGVSENHREQLQTMYGFVLLSGVPHAEQAAKMQAMKEEDERKAAEEAARKAAEEAAKNGGDVAMPTAPADQQFLERAAAIMGERGDQPHWKNTGIAMKYFIEKGLTPEQAAGILGNLLVESASTMDPGIQQIGGGPGRGIAQWGSFNSKYDRFGYNGDRGLVLFASQQGKNWDDLQVQLDFIMHEFGTTEKRAFEYMKGAKSVQEAAFEFEDKFERAGVPHMGERNKRAEMVYEEYQNSMNRAKTELTEQYEREKAAAEEAARIAAEEAARKAAEEAERQNGMSSGRAISGSLAERYGGVSGKIDESELMAIALPYANGGTVHAKFQKEAGEQFAKLNEAYKARWGVDMLITDHYRPYDVQVELKQRYNAQGKGHLAATPGKSNHGWGMAVDMGQAVGGGFRTEQYQWMMENAPQYGWINPSWAREGSKKAEYWHWEYLGSDANKEGVKQFLG